MGTTPRCASALLLTLVLSSTSSTRGEEIKWLLTGPDNLISRTNGFEKASAASDIWQASVAMPDDPWVVLKPVAIDADLCRFLCFRAAIESGGLQIFFSDDGGVFTETNSSRVGRLTNGTNPGLIVIDMAATPGWHGQIASLRIDIDGARRGDLLTLAAVGVSEQAPKDTEPFVAHPSGTRVPVELRRSAAWHDTIVTMLGTNGSAAALTYVKDRFTYVGSYQLAKFLVKIERDGRLIPCSRVTEPTILDFPGGVSCSYSLDGVEVTAEILPLMIGRNTPEQDGAVLYAIRTKPPAKVVLDIGEGAVDDFTAGPSPVEDETMSSTADKVTNEAGTAVFMSPQRPLAAAIAMPSQATVRRNARGGQYLRVTLDSGEGTVLLGYAPEAARAIEIARTDPIAGRRQVEGYYAQLLQCRVETPVKSINDAFRGALITLEYNWCRPFGWNESIQFWHALWHMQHTAGAEWIGQADRSRQCNVTHAENLMPDGAVPHMMSYRHTRRDFGGTNQFFCWQVRHYWNFTADHAFAEKLAPVLDRVIGQSYAENDPDRDGLLGWGLQIGNQEDYIATPGDGTTPSIEGLNMYRARRELAIGLNDDSTAARCDAEIGRIIGRLRDRLWQDDLGRFAFWRDPLGAARLDGQYHTLLYPVIWEIVGPLDGWTSLRHLRDRLIDETGATYCSNNFPNHVIATVGTQAGVAQQPWAAWGLAKAGLRNEAWRPLAAAADWVMDKNHRGTWPEISGEPNPAHFSPPAGLFVAATVEALFGLQVRKPEGKLLVSPAFPDDWNKASLHLPEYQAEYHRNGNTMEYVVRSHDALARQLRWSLSPCQVLSVRVDGRAVEYTLEPGVACIFLSLQTRPTRQSRINITVAPIAQQVFAPGSIAEGEPIEIKVKGLGVERVDDPCAVLDRIQIGDSGRVTARVRENLLRPYIAYGRLGQLNFSRRSFFLYCRSDKDTHVWLPVDLTVLPRCEAAPTGPVKATANGCAVSLLVRNNTNAPLKGIAWLEAAQGRFPLQMDIPARSETEISAAIPAKLRAFVSPGDNSATLILPGHAVINLTLDAGDLSDSQGILRRFARERLTNVPLPETDLIADADWPTLRPFKAYPHMPWAGSRPPLEALGDGHELVVPGLDDVRFEFLPRRFLPISYRIGKPVWSLTLGDREYKKLYLLVIPFLDSHDMFSPAAEVSVQTVSDGVFTRTLALPGDLDWWSSPQTVGDFATARKNRSNRFALLPLLKPDQADWAEGKPPAFPQPEFWATCRAISLATSVLSVVELDLGKTTPLRSLTISTIGVQPGLGLVAITGETSGGMETLRGTPYEPPAELREPRVLMWLDRPENLEGWKTEGQAFTIASFPALFAMPTLNSLARAGEQAVGKAISPDFLVDDRILSFQIQGGRSQSESGPGLLCVRLVDTGSGETLHTVKPPGTHAMQRVAIPLDKWQGRTVRLEVIDENARSSYAWIGIREVKLSAE